MKLMGPLIIVKNMETSIAFYTKLLDEVLKYDLGTKRQFESGLTLQSAHSIKNRADGARQTAIKEAFLLNYETEEFDRFLILLKALGARFVNDADKPSQFDWGQRYIRFYDPDGHVVQVGESMGDVIRRFFAQGLTVEDIVSCTDFPLAYVEECLK